MVKVQSTFDKNMIKINRHQTFSCKFASQFYVKAKYNDLVEGSKCLLTNINLFNVMNFNEKSILVLCSKITFVKTLISLGDYIQLYSGQIFVFNYWFGF